jgi:ribosomal-protein-serine acetyltransferase
VFKLNIDKQLDLVLVDPSFASSYYTLVLDERDYLGKWLVWPKYADSKEFFSSFVNKSLEDYENGKSLTCAIIYCDKLVGNISFNSISHELKKVEVGYWLSSKYQGKGIVTKSLSKLISYAFSSLNMDRVQISVATENVPSRNVCERLNFAFEGAISNSENLNGCIIAHAIYSLSKEQWVEICKNFKQDC